MKNDPVDSVTREDRTEATMPLSAAKLYGHTNYRSLQGQSMQKFNTIPGLLGAAIRNLLVRALIRGASS